jgi:hypothetical protein
MALAAHGEAAMLLEDLNRLWLIFGLLIWLDIAMGWVLWQVTVQEWLRQRRAKLARVDAELWGGNSLR